MKAFIEDKVQNEFCAWLRPFGENEDRFPGTCGETTSSLWQCEHCGYSRFYPAPTAAELDHHYQTDYPQASVAHYDLAKEYERTDLPAVAQHLIDLVREHGVTDERLETHDYGCGMGNLVYALRQAGVSATGHDVNRDWVSSARVYLGDAISAEPFEAIFKESNRRLHLVTMLHVLEHTASPLETLLEIRTRLHPTGLLYVCVPNACFLPGEVLGKRSDENFMFPTHLHYFSRQSADCLLRAAGFRLVHIETRESHLTPSGEEAFVRATTALGHADTPLRTYADLGRTAELFMIAVRDDNAAMANPEASRKVARTAGLEQTLWRRLEAKALACGRGTLIHVVGEDDVSAVLGHSKELTYRHEIGRLIFFAADAYLPPDEVFMLAKSSSFHLVCLSRGDDGPPSKWVQDLAALGLGARLTIMPDHPLLRPAVIRPAKESEQAPLDPADEPPPSIADEPEAPPSNLVRVTRHLPWRIERELAKLCGTLGLARAASLLWNSSAERKPD